MPGRLGNLWQFIARWSVCPLTGASTRFFSQLNRTKRFKNIFLQPQLEWNVRPLFINSVTTSDVEEISERLRSSPRRATVSITCCVGGRASCIMEFVERSNYSCDANWCNLNFISSSSASETFMMQTHVSIDWSRSDFVFFLLENLKFDFWIYLYKKQNCAFIGLNLQPCHAQQSNPFEAFPKLSRSEMFCEQKTLWSVSINFNLNPPLAVGWKSFILCIEASVGKLCKYKEGGVEPETETCFIVCWNYRQNRLTKGEALEI